ncbi:hypothetical protein DCPSUM001_05410 [Dysgonomonas capnocytophagoides]|nr:hypothetical protein DCPSUM001_05410 [Dysgonomonas capnocytophagoides]
MIIGRSIEFNKTIAIDNPSAFNEKDILGLLIHSNVKVYGAAAGLCSNKSDIENTAPAIANNIATFDANRLPEKYVTNDPANKISNIIAIFIFL